MDADILDFRVESSSGFGVDYINPGGNDRITGTRYDDSFVLSSGTEVINGGEGNDRVSYVNSTGAVQVNLANTTQQGGYAAGDQLTSIEDVIGSAYGDRLSGNNALNRLEGRGGNDILFGGFDGQRDVLDGGADTDLVDYSSALRSMTITLGNGATAGSAMLHASSFTPIYGAGGQLTGGSAQPPVQEDVLFNIENVVGTNFGDFITGNSESNDLRGLGGNDTIIRTGGGRDTIDGGGDIDTLVIEETDGTGVTVNMGIALWAVAGSTSSPTTASLLTIATSPGSTTLKTRSVRGRSPPASARAAPQSPPDRAARWGRCVSPASGAPPFSHEHTARVAPT
jgi:Ca2+-binding RTX toxin-like protein